MSNVNYSDGTLPENFDNIVLNDSTPKMNTLRFLPVQFWSHEDWFKFNVRGLRPIVIEEKKGKSEKWKRV